MSIKDKINGFLTGIIANLGEDVVIKLAKKYLTAENVKGALDSLIDKLEEIIAKSETSIDDKLVLPILKKVREALNIPDND